MHEQNFLQNLCFTESLRFCDVLSFQKSDVLKVSMIVLLLWSYLLLHFVSYACLTFKYNVFKLSLTRLFSYTFNISKTHKFSTVRYSIMHWWVVVVTIMLDYLSVVIYFQLRLTFHLSSDGTRKVVVALLRIRMVTQQQ